LAAAIKYPARQPEFMGETADEGAKADPLYSTCNDDMERQQLTHW
jgi:hypothetical protein